MNNKVYLNGVVIELGLDNLPNIQAFNKILHYSAYKGLTVYFDDLIYGVRSNCVTEEILDDNGCVMMVMICDDGVYCENRKALGNIGDIDQCSENSIHVSEFVYKNKLYFPLDVSGTVRTSQELTINSFYCLGDDIAQYKKNAISADALANATAEPTPPYLDPVSTTFSPELDLAIKLHNAIHIEKYGNTAASIESRVSSWLNENENKNGESHAAAKVSRLATIIGIKKQIP